MGSSPSKERPARLARAPSFVLASDDAEPVIQPEPIRRTKPLVVAIDLGTTYSGFAFSFGHDQNTISSNNWQNAPVVKEKAPTCLLLTPDKQLHSFGYEAKTEYGNLTASKGHSDWYFFWQFKMTLHQSKELHSMYSIKDEHGKEVDALLVFSLSIQYIKDQCLDIIHRSSTVLTDSDITWVITVPAIWKESAKKFMRIAAEKAGLDKGSVEIALEPEAAALYCHTVYQREDRSSNGPYQQFDVGTKYMLLDCGGGTVDVAVHEVMPGNTLKELHAASGGDWGGSKVNKAFLSFMSNIVGPPAWQGFFNNNKEDYIHLIDEFENKKRTIGPDSNGVERMRLPLSLQEMFRKMDQDRLKDKYGGKVSLVGDKFSIDSEMVKGFFTAVIGDISKHVTDLLETVPGPIVAVLMVGGFSESKLLQDSVKRAIGNTCRIIVPIDASLCVVKGAVLYGHDPLKVTLRKIPFTYGIASTVAFDPVKHPPKKKVIIHGKPMCDEVFDKHVTAGQEVKTGEATEEKTYYQMTAHDKVIAIVLYRSSELAPSFTDEEGCEMVGTFLIDLPPRIQHLKGNQWRGVQVKMVFGGTDITVIATMDGQIHCVDFSL